MVTLRPVTSTTVIAIGHDGFDLYVLFRSQKLYCYQAVPVDLFDALKAAPSKGSFLNAEIKPKFSYVQSTESYRVQTQRSSILGLLPGPSFGF